MRKTKIAGGRLLDPSADRDEIGDLLVVDGKIAEVGGTIEAEDAEVIDARGCWVAPGFVDIHTHLREPGQEYKEDLGSGRSKEMGGSDFAVNESGKFRKAVTSAGV